MARRRKREPTPFEVIEQLNLRTVPLNPVKRLLMRPSDYEIILAQQYEIMDLQRQLEESRGEDASGS